MPKSNKNLERSLRKSNKKKEDKVVLLSGQLGIPLNGNRVVEVPNRRGFVFVRLKGNTSELIQAYNATVSPIYDLPVLVARTVGVYKVIGRNLERYTNQWGLAPYLPKHGAQHSFNPEINIGGDVVWVYSPQFMPLLGYPSGTSGSPRLSIAPYYVRGFDGAWKYVGNTGTPDVTPYLPTTGSQAVMALVYIDTVSGNPYLLVNSGTYMDASLTGSSHVAPYIPRVTNPNHLPLTAIRLVSGATVLTWNNLYDVRPFLQVIPTGTSGGGGAGTLNIQDEGVPLGTASTLNVVGVNADISISGSVARLFITGSTGGGTVNPPITGSFVVQDDGQTLGSALILNAGRRLAASISGSVAEFDADAALLRTDDLTQYISGSRTTFPLSFVPEINTARLYYNGLRQRFQFHYNISGSYVETYFTPVTGSVLLIDYNEYSATGTSNNSVGIQDEGILQGVASVLNFVGANVQASVLGNVATINITGSSGGGSPWNLLIDESGASFGNFTSLAGAWSSDGTVIKQTTTAAGFYSCRHNTKTPGSIKAIQVDIQIKSSGADRIGGVLVAFNGSSPNNTMGVRLNEGGDQIIIENFASGNQETFSTTINVDIWYTIKLQSSAQTVSIWKDGTLIGSGYVGAYAGDMSFMGLYAYQAEVWFRNLKVWEHTMPV